MEHSRAAAALLFVSMLLIPQVYAALPPGTGSGGGTTTANASGNPCLIEQHGVTLDMPCLPTIPLVDVQNTSILAQTLAISPWCSHDPNAPNPCASWPSFNCTSGSTLTSSVTVPVINYTVTVPNPLGFVTCIGKYIASLVLFIPTLIVQTIANWLIAGYDWVIDSIVNNANYWLDKAWNAILEGINIPIGGFDGISAGLGNTLLGAILSLPEPWSTFLTPAIWLSVILIIFALAVTLIYIGKYAVDAVEIGAEAA